MSSPYVGRVGKGKTVVSVGLPNAFVAVLEERAAALRWSRAEFVLAVLERWRDEGCPPVSEPDRLMQIAKHGTAAPMKPEKRTRSAA